MTALTTRDALAKARDDIRDRRREFARLGADEQYLLALDDAYGLVSNRLRDAVVDAATLADDEALFEQTLRHMYDHPKGPPPPPEWRLVWEHRVEEVLRALAAALSERGDS